MGTGGNGLERHLTSDERTRILRELNKLGRIVTEVLPEFSVDRILISNRPSLEQDCRSVMEEFYSLPENHWIRTQYQPDLIIKGYEYACSYFGWTPYQPPKE